MRVNNILIYTILAGMLVTSCKPKEARDKELPAPSVATFEMIRYDDPNYPEDKNTYIFRNTTDGGFISSWDFGGYQQSRASSDTIFFAQAGTYTIRLTTSSKGGTTTVSKDLVITETSPFLANFITEPVNGNDNNLKISATSPGLISAKFNYANGDSALVAVDTVYFPFKGTYDVTLNVNTIKGPSFITKQITIQNDDPNNPYASDPVMTMLTGGPTDLDGKTWVLDGSPGAGGVGGADANTTNWYTNSQSGYSGAAFDNGMGQNSFTFTFRDYQFTPKNNMATVHFAYANKYFGKNQGQYQDIALPDPRLKQAPFILRQFPLSTYPYSWSGYAIDITNVSYFGYNEHHPAYPQYRYRYEVVSITDTKMVVRHHYLDDAEVLPGSEYGFRYFTFLAQ